MLERAMFAFPDQSSAGEDDRQHGDVVAELHDRSEPALVELGVETGTYG
jgi:hypothetical protein